MAKLQIRHAKQADLEQMLALDHRSSAAWAYKMDVLHERAADSFTFQRVRLPKTVSINYPKDEPALMASWANAESIYVGCLADQVVAYAAVEGKTFPGKALINDLVVANDLRRKGVASKMFAACELWAKEHQCSRLLMAVPVRNDPAIGLLKKNGFSICGYLDAYFPNGDTAMFFELRVG